MGGPYAPPVAEHHLLQRERPNVPPRRDLARRRERDLAGDHDHLGLPAYRHAHAYPDSYPYGDAYPDSYPHADAYPYADANAYPYACDDVYLRSIPKIPWCWVAWRTWHMYGRSTLGANV